MDIYTWHFVQKSIPQGAPFCVGPLLYSLLCSVRFLQKTSIAERSVPSCFFLFLPSLLPGSITGVLFSLICSLQIAQLEYCYSKAPWMERCEMSAYLLCTQCSLCQWNCPCRIEARACLPRGSRYLVKYLIMRLLICSGIYSFQSPVVPIRSFP